MSEPASSIQHPASQPAPLFVTVEDHRAGFKVVQVEFLAGAVQELKLSAPARRLARRALGQPFADGDAFLEAVVSLCLPEHLRHQEGAHFLDLLTPASANLVEVTSYTLTFGLAAQKKMESATLAALTHLANSAPSSASVAAAGELMSSILGAGPSSGSGSPSPSSRS